MFVFVTAEPYGAYHLVPLAPYFADHAVHLLPNTGLPPNTPPSINTTRDTSVLTTATAVIITGGVVNTWTEHCATTAAHHGIDVYYIELAYAHGTPHTHPASWLTAAFCGSEYSRAQLASHLHTAPANINVIGYPHLDDITPATPDTTATQSRVLILGTIDSPPWDDINAALATGLYDLGCHVTTRHHPRANPAPQPTLAEQLTTTDIVVGAPGTAYLAAAAAGIPIWVPQHPSLPTGGALTHLETLANPLPLTTADSSELTALTRPTPPPSPETIEYYLGPTDRSAAQRLWTYFTQEN